MRSKTVLREVRSIAAGLPAPAADPGKARRVSPGAPVAPWRSPSGLLNDVARSSIVGLAYYVAAILSLRLALVRGQVTPIWPPTGIAVAALLLFGLRLWPGIFLGALLVNLPISPHPLVALGIAGSNTLAPVVAAMLLRRLGFRSELSRLRDAI